MHVPYDLKFESSICSILSLTIRTEQLQVIRQQIPGPPLAPPARGHLRRRRVAHEGDVSAALHHTADGAHVPEVVLTSVAAAASV